MSEEGWLSEDACCCIYVLYLMHMYGCTYPNRIIFYVRTYVLYSYLQSAGGFWCVSECMCVCASVREREGKRETEKVHKTCVYQVCTSKVPKL